MEWNLELGRRAFRSAYLFDCVGSFLSLPEDGKVVPRPHVKTVYVKSPIHTPTGELEWLSLLARKQSSKTVQRETGGDQLKNYRDEDCACSYLQTLRHGASR